MDIQRKAGITASAIVVALGSVGFFMVALLMVMTALTMPSQPEPPPFVKPIAFAMAIALSASGAWGIATAVALFRLSRWSRSSMLVFSVLLALFSISAGLATAAARFPLTPGAPASLPATTKIAFTVFYVLLFATASFWLFYFNRTAVRAQFHGGSSSLDPEGRPLSISVIGWFWIVGGAIGLVMAFLPLPFTIFAFVLTGWGAHVGYFFWSSVNAVAGRGLLRLQPWSRIAVIAMCIFGVLNALISLLVPGNEERVRTLMKAMPAGMQFPSVAPPTGASMAFSLIPTILACAAPIWFLTRHRQSFAGPGRIPELPTLTSD